MIILGYFVLAVGTGVFLGWLFPLVSGIVRMRRNKAGGKGRLVFGGIWGILAFFLASYAFTAARSVYKQYQAEDFNPGAYQQGDLGTVTLPFKGESSLVLYEATGGKQIRFKTSDGLFQVPAGEYRLSSWQGTLTATDDKKSKWTASAKSYFPSGDKRVSVAAGSTVELNDALFSCFNNAPELKIVTKPDPNKKGNTGIGLSIAAGDVNLDYQKEGDPVEAAVEIKAGDGKVVYKDTARIDKFSFG